ncbi:GSCOCG00000336001-RA-CDS [Cotesia congregata]|nr:GSCOCG00000336001-RA-CDS [Cotesia congregata]
MASLRTLIDTLCPLWAKGPTPNVVSPFGDQFLDLPFSREELDFAIDNLKTKSSPGPDGIDYKMIMELPEEGKKLLLRFYNEIFHSQLYPEEWRRFGIFFIPKAEKDKFRPISLASCTLKLMERMINTRITWWLEHFGLLPESQNGFRKQRSCSDNLAILLAEVIKGFKTDKVTAALFFRH